MLFRPALLLLPTVLYFSRVQAQDNSPFVQVKQVEILANQFEWATKANGAGEISANNMAVSSDGKRIAVVGLFNSPTIVFYDQLNQALNTKAASDRTGSYLALYSMNGSVVWSAVFDNPGNNVNATSVSICQDGSVVVGGYFFGTGLNVTDNNGALVGSITSRFSRINGLTSVSAAFYAKFTSSGQFAWIKEWSGHMAAFVSGITCDSKNRIYLIGRFPPSGSYMPHTLTSPARAGGNRMSNYWLTGGTRQVVGSVFFEIERFVTPASVGGGFAVWSSGWNTYMQLIQADSGALKWYVHRPVLGWLVQCQHPWVGSTPVLGGTALKLSWSYEFLDGARMRIRVSADDAVFLECPISASINVDPALSNGGQAAYLVRGDNWGPVPSAELSSELKVWRGLPTMVRVNSDGDFSWSAAVNATANMQIVQMNGLVTVAGALPSTSSNMIYRYLDSGSFVWSADIQGLQLEDRTDTLITSIGVDGEGNVVAIGVFAGLPLGVIDISRQQVATIPSVGTFSGFVVCLDSLGQYQWHLTMSSNLPVQMNSVTIDRAGGVAIAGGFTTSMSVFNVTGARVASLSNAGYLNGFLLRLSPTGQLRTTAQMRGVGLITGKTVAFTQAGDLFAFGDYYSATFSINSPQLGNAQDVLDNMGVQSAFLVKFNSTSSSGLLTVTVTPTIAPTPTQTNAPLGSGNPDFFKNLFDQAMGLGQVTLIVIGVLIFLFYGFVGFLFYTYLRYLRLKAARKGEDTYFVVEDAPVKEQRAPKMAGAFPAHLELRNRMDFMQGERMPTGPETFIFKCTLRNNNSAMARNGKAEDVVIKVIAKNENLLKADQKMRFQMEISALWKLKQSKNVLKLIGYCREPVGLIMRHYNYGSLSHWIYASSETPSEYKYTRISVSKMLLDIAKAVAYIHQNKLIHGDVNSSNILLERQGFEFIPILTDFSNCHPVDSPDSMRVIKNESIAYTAPEVLSSFGSDNENSSQKPQIAKAGDVYAIAMIVFEVINRRLWPAPINQVNVDDAFKQIENMFDF